LTDLNGQIPQLEALAGKPFERDAELRDMKSGLTKLEREIAQKIKAMQQAQNGFKADDEAGRVEKQTVAISDVPHEPVEPIVEARENQLLNKVKAEVFAQVAVITETRQRKGVRI